MAADGSQGSRKLCRACSSHRSLEEEEEQEGSGTLTKGHGTFTQQR